MAAARVTTTQDYDDLGLTDCPHFVSRHVLESRLDPACPHAPPELANRNRTVILICDEVYRSSLAAATLRTFGLDRLTASSLEPR